MVAGSVTVDTWQGAAHQRVTLAKGGPGIRLRPGEFSCQSEFSADAVLLVLASETFDPDGYIDAEEFFGPGRIPSWLCDPPSAGSATDPSPLA